MDRDLAYFKLIQFFSLQNDSSIPKIEEVAEILSNSPSRFQPFSQGVFNPENILNGTPQNSHGSFTTHKLHKLLDSVKEPAREFMVKVGDFWEFLQITHETSIDHMSNVLEVLREKFQCGLERLSVDTAFARHILMNLDGTSTADVTPIVTDPLSLTKNKTDAEREDILGIKVHL